MALSKLVIIGIGLHARRGGGVLWCRSHHMRRLCYILIGTHQMEDVMLLIDILIAAYYFRKLLGIVQQFARIYQLLVCYVLQYEMDR